MKSAEQCADFARVYRNAAEFVARENSETAHMTASASSVRPYSIPAYAHPAPQVAQAVPHADASLALDLLAELFDAYENGVQCYEDPEDMTGYIGHAFRLPDETFRACGELLNMHRPVNNGATSTPSAPEAQAVPDGWKLVPVEPTPEMLHAAVQAICYGPEGGFTRIGGPGRCWDAMLAAAPSAPAQPAEPLPPPGIHAAVHYATWLRREAHQEQEPRAGALRNAARMIDVLLAEHRRLIQELIDADALAAAAGREACAALCETRQTPGTGSVAILSGAADAIRARKP